MPILSFNVCHYRYTTLDWERAVNMKTIYMFRRVAIPLVIEKLTQDNLHEVLADEKKGLVEFVQIDFGYFNGELKDKVLDGSIVEGDWVDEHYVTPTEEFLKWWKENKDELLQTIKDNEAAGNN